MERDDRILNPNCSEVVFRLPDGKLEMERELKKLQESGIFLIEMPRNHVYLGSDWIENKKSGAKERILFDMENDNIPDFRWHAILKVYKDYNGNDSIIGHQHCQDTMFPTMERIENILDGEWYGQDGGSTFYYDDWLGKKRKPIKSSQTAEGRKLRKEYEKKIKNGSVKIWPKPNEKNKKEFG